ncbi:MAG: adenylate/guanylate cyclase domain-containing protein [Reyranellaceae bacterium]
MREQRRLAAILAADVVGYSRLVGRDESGTVARLRELRAKVLTPVVERRGGRIVKLTGDGALIEFSSAVDALCAAIQFQQAMADAGQGGDPDAAIVFRIGLHMGDVIVEGDDLYGDGVNVAARLEAEAPPGGIAISRSVHEAVDGRVKASFDNRGKLALKHIERPVETSFVSWDAEDWRPAPGKSPAEDADGPAAATLALPSKPSIAVLPFDNMSGDPEQEHFADGVVESITAALSRIRSFFVIARNSAFAYKGKHRNVRDIGRELGVAYVLEGSVQRGGQRVRITVQLIETAGGAHLWAEKYDGTLEDIFDLQDRITEQVAGALQPSIRQAEIERARRKRPQELGAYDYAMRAMQHVWVLEKEQAAQALKLLDKALEIDPDYPLALALASWCWAQSSVYNWADDLEAAKATALSLADRAAARATDDPLILAVLGAVHTFARNFGVARIMLERAVALDPNAAWALSRLAWLDVYADRPQEARANFEKAIRLSPLDPINFNNYAGLASACVVDGKDAEAAEYFLRALEERPNALWLHRHLAAALYGAGKLEEARNSLDIIRAAFPEITVRRFREAMVFSPKTLDRICTQLRAVGLPEE